MTTTVTAVVLVAETTLTNAAATYVTAAANSVTVVKQAVFSNFTAGAVNFTVWRVVSGGTAVNANILIPTRAIAAGQTDRAPEMVNATLNPGDTIQCSASANTSINFTASGLVVTG